MKISYAIMIDTLQFPSIFQQIDKLLGLYKESWKCKGKTIYADFVDALGGLTCVTQMRLNIENWIRLQ